MSVKIHPNISVQYHNRDGKEFIRVYREDGSLEVITLPFEQPKPENKVVGWFEYLTNNCDELLKVLPKNSKFIYKRQQNSDDLVDRPSLGIKLEIKDSLV